MKVLLVNGSPHTKGCTYTALEEIAGTLQKQGIETEIFHIGTKPIAGCIGCGVCSESGQCFQKDIVNDFIAKAKDADGFIFGSPVHFASVGGAISSFMDRVFYGNTKIFEGKPGAGIVSCRRGGATASLDQLNKYFTIRSMPIVSSQYWNMVHGNTPDEVRQDLEGLQIMRTLGNNMAWLLKCIKLGKENGIDFPEREPSLRTNFIR